MRSPAAKLVQNPMSLRRPLGVLFLTVTLLGQSVVGLALAAPPYTSPANIVTLQPDADPDAVARDFGLTPVNVYRHALKGFAVTVPTNQLVALRQDPRVVAVEGNGHVYLCAQTSSTGFSRMGMTNYPLVHFNGVDDTRINVDVAILDTGVQTNHPDLNVYRAVAFADTNLPPDDWSGHGTHVAGICGALDNDIGVVGVAPGVRLWSVKVIGQSGIGSWDEVIAGWNYVAEHSDEIEIANCSFSNDGHSVGAPFLAIELSLSNLVSRGVLVVAAAGNSSIDIFGYDSIYGTEDDHLPAANHWISAISGMMDSDGETGSDYMAFGFTNYSLTNAPVHFVSSPGMAIDVCAPSVKIVSTWRNSTYSTNDGTSMAAPHVAGLAALCIAANGRATNAAGAVAIRQAIIEAAQPQSAWQTPDTFDVDGNHEGLAYPSLSWIPAMRFTGQQARSNGFALNFTTLPGYAHTVQFKDALESTNAWQALITTNGTGDLVTVVDETATNALRSYQLRSMPAP